MMKSISFLLAIGVTLFVAFTYLDNWTAESPSSPRSESTEQTEVAASSSVDELWKSISEQSTDEVAESVASFRKLNDHPFFEMTYVGDYNAEQTVDSGDDDSDQAGFLFNDRTSGWACSIFVSYNKNGSAIYGRNFDWQHNAAMLLRTNPSDGYASISMVDISYLGFEKDDAKFDSLDARKALLYAPLIPFDGMNECGLVVAMAAVGETEIPVAPGKRSVGGLQMIRLMLDQAKTTDEALTLFERYNVKMIGGPNIHYLIADRHGESALVELKDGKTNIIKGNGKWQSATNFYITGQDQPKRQCPRFATIEAKMEAEEGGLTSAATLKLLQRVQQPNTQWSAVYDMKRRGVDIALSREFKLPLAFELIEKKSQATTSAAGSVRK
ncbi:MAG: C45 family peptidase [Planctomycetota bacterium]